jgi:hypothetical protein
LVAKRKPVLPERNSAPRIEAAKRLLPPDWAKRRQTYEKAFGSQPVDAPVSRIQQAALQTLRKRAAAALAEARSLTDFPEGRHAINYARDYLTTLLPHAVNTRTVSDLLSLDVLGQALDGHPNEALASCRAIVNASRSLSDEPSAISQLVRIGVVFFAAQGAERVLRYGVPAAPDLEALQRLLEQEAEAPVLLTMARAERGGLHWFMSAVTSGDLDPAAVGNLPELKALKAMPSGLALRHAHAWLLQHMTRCVQIARHARMGPAGPICPGRGPSAAPRGTKAG